MANDKVEAAAAVLEAMGGEAVTVETPTEEVKVAKAKKAVKKVRDAAKAEAKAKAKAEREKERAAKKAKALAPKRPGPKTVPVLFPVNTKHKAADGGEIEIVKTRISYLVRLPERNGKPGRLKWFSSLKTQAMVESKSAIEAEHEEAEASEAAA